MTATTALPAVEALRNELVVVLRAEGPLPPRELLSRVKERLGGFDESDGRAAMLQLVDRGQATLTRDRSLRLR